MIDLNKTSEVIRLLVMATFCVNRLAGGGNFDWIQFCVRRYRFLFSEKTICFHFPCTLLQIWKELQRIKGLASRGEEELHVGRQAIAPIIEKIKEHTGCITDGMFAAALCYGAKT